MKVTLRNPVREMAIDGPVQVLALLPCVALNNETHPVIGDRPLVAADKTLRRDAEVENRSCRHRFGGPNDSRAAERAPCPAGGLSERHLFDEAVRPGDFGAVVTGHDLDDEGAVLLGNGLRWPTHYLVEECPMTPVLIASGRARTRS